MTKALKEELKRYPRNPSIWVFQKEEWKEKENPTQEEIKEIDEKSLPFSICWQ